ASASPRPARMTVRLRPRRAPARPRGTRSEEHTSELQSLTNLVCRLLLEKKKKNERRKTIIRRDNIRLIISIITYRQCTRCIVAQLGSDLSDMHTNRASSTCYVETVQDVL